MPSTPTEIGGGVTLWLLGVHFVNRGAGPHVVTLVNSADKVIWEETIPGGSGSLPFDPTFEPTVGLKWSVDSGTEVFGHVWGYQ